MQSSMTPPAAVERFPLLSLKSVRLFQNLRDDELTAIRSHLVEKRFQKGDPVFQEGCPCEQVAIVASGRIKVFRAAPNGREQILEILGPGDSCACHPGLANWCCGASAEAMTEATFWLLPLEAYKHLLKTNSKMALSLSAIFACRLKAFSALVEEVSLKDAKRKLVGLLLTLAKDRGIPTRKGTLIVTDFTREQMAARIGAARETVVRLLYELRRRRLIRLKPRRSITLLDQAGLEKLL